MKCTSLALFDSDEVGLLMVPRIEGTTAFMGYLGKKADSEKKLLNDVFEVGDRYFNSRLLCLRQ